MAFALRHCLRYINRHGSIRKCSSSNLNQPTVFSGIQPSGIPHLGNYFGAIKPWIDLQETYDGRMIFCIVDMHAITQKTEATTLRINIRDMAASLLACGIDPNKAILFQQSSVPAHSQLCWVLSCNVTLSRLRKLPQWRQKLESAAEDAHVHDWLGLMTYPVLQTADIMLYRTTDVPVGADQEMHIHFAKDFIEKFNGMYEADFPLPVAHISQVPRLKSLRFPNMKMSKTNQEDRSRINITDRPDVIRDKVKRAVTDTTPSISHDPAHRPGVSNLVDIYAAVTDMTSSEVVQDCSDLDTLSFKLKLADLVSEHLEPIANQMDLITDDFITDVLKYGQYRAQEVAEKNIEYINHKVGFR